MPSLSIWTVYDRPSDHPDKIVARRFEIRHEGPVPTTDTIVSQSLDGLRKVLHHCYPDACVLIPRSPEDDPHILESWV